MFFILYKHFQNTINLCLIKRIKYLIKYLPTLKHCNIVHWLVVLKVVLMFMQVQPIASTRRILLSYTVCLLTGTYTPKQHSDSKWSACGKNLHIILSCINLQKERERKKSAPRWDVQLTAKFGDNSLYSAHTVQ